MGSATHDHVRPKKIIDLNPNIKEDTMKIEKEGRISGKSKPAIRDLTLINEKESVHTSEVGSVSKA